MFVNKLTYIVCYKRSLKTRLFLKRAQNMFRLCFDIENRYNGASFRIQKLF